ncbi:sensor histidine kinase [Orientia tsutsugamushi]|uniref:ATP-binding protein n=1 Tax=Orientia tsutsugamushi TaxID=784 RepID=A0A2U3RCX6_ORITS|nr:ATP-binding protein [Orientia tsutsugamushi]SPR11000.1 ATP-binding protein [Orientia tsutsugamushi]
MKNDKYIKNIQLLLQYLVKGDFSKIPKQIVRLRLSVIGLFKLIQRESIDYKIIKNAIYRLVREYKELFISTAHEEIYLRSLLEKSISDIRDNESDCIVYTDYDYEKIRMTEYGDEIQQILTQLLDNANRFGEKVKVILIRVRLLNPDIRDKTLELTIRNNGNNIKKLQKINTAFKTPNEDNVLGLGLTFVKLLLQAIKGEITYVKNEHTEVICRVPIYAHYL